MEREKNIQVNAVSTLLLACLLLAGMKPERANRSSAAHLSIVGSMRFADPDITQWALWQSENGQSVLEHLNNPRNWPGGSGMYAATKLIVTYGYRELVERARGTDGR